MTLFYDILILAGIIATAVPTAILLFHKYRTQNSWEYKNPKKTTGISIFLLLGTFILLYGTFAEPLMLVTNYQIIDLKNINKPIRITLISDIHVGDFNTEKDIQKIANRILEINPDLLFIDGDHVLGHAKNANLDYLKPLKQVVDKIPTYAVPGNHEYGVATNNPDVSKRFLMPNRSVEVAKAMREMGIHYMINETEKITMNDQSFLLFGADEYLINNIRYESLIQKKLEYPDLPVIALIHNPSGIYDAADQGIDLVLSGHTHGGQIRLPFIGTIMKVEDKEFPTDWYQGLHQYKNTKLFVTSGANESGTRARLFNPPEVVLLEVN